MLLHCVACPDVSCAVARYPFDDHNAPPFELFLPFCQDVVSGWLGSRWDDTPAPDFLLTVSFVVCDCLRHSTRGSARTLTTSSLCTAKPAKAGRAS